MSTLTTNQQVVLNFCRERVRITGMMPSNREINTHMNWRDSNRATEMLTTLAAHGYVRIIEPGKRPSSGVSRKWELIEQ